SNDYSLGLEMSYELDVWGKYRSGALAAANDLVAAQYFRESVRITVAAEAELSAVVADIARARQSIGLLESAIATLTGRSPRAVFMPEVARGATIEAATAVPQLPSGLPSGLLERRPDIRRAEALLAASDLRIQQARANY